MKLTGKVLLVVLSVGVLVTALCGCMFWRTDYEYSETEQAKLKQNVNTPYGQSAALYDGRIYYVSQETGKDGLHSMAGDGSDVRYEFSLPRITRLIVREDGVHYVGLREVDENWWLFSLYRYDTHTGTVEQVEYSDVYTDNTYDAYITEDGTICALDRGWAQYSAEMAYITDSEIEGFDEPIGQIRTVIRGERLQSVRLMNDLVLVQNDEMVFGREYTNKGTPYQNIIGDEVSSFYDKKYGEIAMGYRDLESDEYFKVVYADDEKMLCALNNTLLELNPQTLELQFIHILRDTDVDMKITFLFMAGDEIFVMMENESGEKIVYRPYDYQSYCKDLISFYDDKLLLNIDERGILWVEEGKICFSEMDLEQHSGYLISNNMFEIEMPKDIMEGNLFEIAGDWLFIHELSKTKAANRLLYKVNLKTQEVIEIG